MKYIINMTTSWHEQTFCNYEPSVRGSQWWQVNRWILFGKVYPDSKVHGAYVGPTGGRQGPRWDPFWPHDPCYLGSITSRQCSTHRGPIMWGINVFFVVSFNKLLGCPKYETPWRSWYVISKCIGDWVKIYNSLYFTADDKIINKFQKYFIQHDKNS